MAAKTQDGEWFVAAESFVSQDGLAYHKDITRVRKGDPILKIAAHLFKPLGESYHGAPDVEASTAAPGEKRGEEKAADKPGGVTLSSLKGE